MQGYHYIVNCRTHYQDHAAHAALHQGRYVCPRVRPDPLVPGSSVLGTPGSVLRAPHKAAVLYPLIPLRFTRDCAVVQAVCLLFASASSIRSMFG